MEEIIYFQTEQELDNKSFEEFLSSNLALKKFLWINNFYEFTIDNTLDPALTYISKEVASNGFKFYYSVFANYDTMLSLRQRVELLKILSQKENISILSTDDEISPYSWVLIEPDGQTSTIETAGEHLTIEGFYNFPFGDFRTKAKLNDEELGILKQIISKGYPNVTIHHGFDGPVINGDFNKVKNNFEQLRLFENHYEIVPTGKNEWLDKNEKSELFIRLMKVFQSQINKELCLFPPNYSEVENIEGGSDSEEYCLVLSKDKMEKITYKHRRKSWIV